MRDCKPGDRVRVKDPESRHFLKAGEVTHVTTLTSGDQGWPVAVVKLDGETGALRVPFLTRQIEPDHGAATFAAETPAPPGGGYQPEPMGAVTRPASAVPGACLYGYAGACSCDPGACRAGEAQTLASYHGVTFDQALAAMGRRWIPFSKRQASERMRVVGQSRLGSICETAASTAIGYGVAVASQALVFPLFGFHASTQTHMTIAAFFTAISIARGYLVRRLFNWIHHK